MNQVSKLPSDTFAVNAQNDQPPRIEVGPPALVQERDVLLQLVKDLQPVLYAFDDQCVAEHRMKRDLIARVRRELER